MKQVNIAVLGMGFIGKVHAYAYTVLPFYYGGLAYRPKLTAVYNRTLAAAQQAKDEYGFEFATDDLEQIWQRDDIDAVSICLPNAQHMQCVLKAAERGMHIYCEKPLAANEDEAQRIVSALEGSDICHRIVFHNRFFAAVMRARQIIDEGRLGRILSFHASYQHSGNADSNKTFDWKCEKAVACGGVLFDMGSHVLDMLYYLIGDYKALFAKTQIAHEMRRDDKGRACSVQVEDAAYIVAQMACGAMGTLNVSKIATGTNDEFIVEIFGEKGALKFDLMDPNWVWFYDATAMDKPLGGYCGFTKIEAVQRYEKPGGSFPSPKLAGGWLRAHVHSVYCFLEAVHSGTSGRPNLNDGAYIQHVMQKAYESNKKGVWLNV